MDGERGRGARAGAVAQPFTFIETAFKCLR